MKKILMINGHQPYSYARGKLNKTLFDFIENYLKTENEIKNPQINFYLDQLKNHLDLIF